MRLGATEQNVIQGGSAEVQPLNGGGGGILNLLFSIFGRKGTPFIYLPLKNGTQYTIF